MIKPPNKPLLLTYFEALRERKTFSKEEKQIYLKLKKDYEGEQLFLDSIQKIESDWIVLSDMLFESNQTTFQTDSLIITPSKIYLYEVKYYEGDFYFEADKLYKKPRREVLNPLHQLSRTESLLRPLLLQPNVQLGSYFGKLNRTTHPLPLHSLHEPYIIN